MNHHVSSILIIYRVIHVTLYNYSSWNKSHLATHSENILIISLLRRIVLKTQCLIQSDCCRTRSLENLLDCPSLGMLVVPIAWCDNYIISYQPFLRYVMHNRNLCVTYISSIWKHRPSALNIRTVQIKCALVASEKFVPENRQLFVLQLAGQRNFKLVHSPIIFRASSQFSSSNKDEISEEFLIHSILENHFPLDKDCV